MFKYFIILLSLINLGYTLNIPVITNASEYTIIAQQGSFNNIPKYSKSTKVFNLTDNSLLVIQQALHHVYSFIQTDKMFNGYKIAISTMPINNLPNKVTYTCYYFKDNNTNFYLYLYEVRTGVNIYFNINLSYNTFDVNSDIIEITPRNTYTDELSINCSSIYLQYKPQLGGTKSIKGK